MTKKIFTRVTLDDVLTEAVSKIQASLPNYDLNDAIKLLLGVGVKNLDSMFLDLNGFNSQTRNKLLKAKVELEQEQGTEFVDFEALKDYANSK